MADETPDLTPAEVAAARAEFVANPPAEIVDAPVVAAPDTAAEEAAAIEEALAAGKPPAAPEGVPTPAPAPAATGPDPFAAFGGRQAVETAHAVQEALRTEQGLRALVANGLLELGYDVNQVRAALDAAEEAPAPAVVDDPFAGLEDDEPVTAGQARQLAQQIAQSAVEQALAQQQAALQPVQEQFAQQQQTAVRSVTDQAVIELLGMPPVEPEKLEVYQRQVDAIVERGARYFDPNQWANPQHVRSAVIQANAEIQAEQEQRFKDFLQRRREVRDSSPVNIGGGAGSEGPLAEPKTMEEARKQAAAVGFFDA